MKKLLRTIRLSSYRNEEAFYYLSYLKIKKLALIVVDEK